MLTGDNRATAERIAASWALTPSLPKCCPTKSQQGEGVAGPGQAGGDGWRRINDAPALAQADVGIAIGAGTDVAMETADVVLMKSDPFDVIALSRSAGHRQQDASELVLAAGYNTIAFPIAAGLFYPPSACCFGRDCCFVHGGQFAAGKR